MLETPPGIHVLYCSTLLDVIQARQRPSNVVHRSAPSCVLFVRFSLAGTGVRVKKIGPAAVKVYAVGLYVEAKGAKSELASHK